MTLIAIAQAPLRFWRDIQEMSLLSGFKKTLDGCIAEVKMELSRYGIYGNNNNFA